MNNTLFPDIACICNTCLIPIFKRVQKKQVSFYIKKLGYWESKFVHDK